MKTNTPPAFSMSFSGPEGPYTVRFQPINEWDGIIEVSIGGTPMRWHVMNVKQEDNGGIVIGGMTNGTEKIWNDQFWFELRPNDLPAVIRYWGNKVIWREDTAA
jgi:hypothetical protein